MTNKPVEEWKIKKYVRQVIDKLSGQYNRHLLKGASKTGRVDATSDIVVYINSLLSHQRQKILEEVEKEANNLIPISGQMRHNEAVLRLSNAKINFDQQLNNLKQK
jgi:hypothetical protein